MTDRVRVLRVLEYEGPRDSIEAMLSNRAVKGERRFMEFIIRESIIGETPVVLESEPVVYHWSDCATNNAPAKEPAACDCGAVPGPGQVVPKPRPCPKLMPGLCSWPRCFWQGKVCCHEQSRDGY